MTTLQALPPATLASLIELVDHEPGLADLPLRGEMISALKTLARVLNREPHMVPATPGELRDLINGAIPSAARVSGTRWRNVKSLVRKALALLDPQVIPARSRAGLLGEWAVLIAKPETKPLWRGLARFSKYCSVRGIGPTEVNQAVYDTFYQDIVAHCLIRSPRETQQTAGHAWNTAVATVPGWPSVTITIADFRRNPSLKWDVLPDSLRRDVDAYLVPRGDDPFDLSSNAPVNRATTIDGKKLQIRQFATALVESGRDPSSLKMLADLVDVDTAKAGLRVLWERGKKEKTKRNHAMAYLLLTIARHWVKSDQTTIDGLAALCRNLAPRAVGMTAKNKQRLQQFADPQVLAALLDLPAKMFDEACRVEVPTKAEARTARVAVAIEILLMAPLRIKNLSELEIGRTLILDRSSIGHIVIDGSEVKNDGDIEIPLPTSALDMIRTYLKRFHPLLAPPGCMMLFPSADGGHMRAPVLGTKITKCLRSRCGIVINPHLFRHLAAKLYLDAFPGAYGIVRMLLGHKSIETTIRIYCGTEFSAAFKAYDALLTRRRHGELIVREPIRLGKGRR